MNDDPKDFQGLVTWAAWFVIDGITKGTPLRSLMFTVLEYARRWNPGATSKEQSNG